MRVHVSALPAVLAVVLAVTPAGGAAAQELAPPPPAVSALAEGWRLLAKGDAEAAGQAAWKVLGQDQHMAGALALAVEAGIARGGSSAGLSAYEKWLGSRRVDEPQTLRRVARAMLVEFVSRERSGQLRLDALKALAADGDPQAALRLEEAAAANQFGEIRALASLGNERAVNRLIAQLESQPGSKTLVIDALGESGSKAAVPHLRALLADPSDLNRASAADALGRLDATEAIPQVRALLQDPVFTVRLKAAGALLRLNDSSGLSLLNELAASEHGGVRVAAARELASQPDMTWQGFVRGLTSDPDPVVRLEAARLIAPYDQALARAVLDALMHDENLGIREAASGVLVDRVAGDFATLRRLLRSGDDLTRGKAAARILELTR
jgi:hypothetical protein